VRLKETREAIARRLLVRSRRVLATWKAEGATELRRAAQQIIPDVNRLVTRDSGKGRRQER
jgi:hypothetical protein